MVVGWCAGSGVELTAASNSPQAMASARLPKALGMAWAAAKSRARSAFMSTAADQLAAGDEGELLGVGAGDGAGAEDEQALGAGGAHR